MSLSLERVVKPEAGWYRGEFHAHTNFSDGHHSPAELRDVARAEGLDTDHNTTGAFSHFGPAPDIVIIPGIEITLKTGHFNIFGLEADPDWLTQIRTGRHSLKLQNDFDTFSKLMEHTAAQGLFNSINHPLLVPWAWLNSSTDLGHLHGLEIWNDPSWSDNQKANPDTVEMWTRWLNAGYRITALGGTDYHHPELKAGYTQPQRMGLASSYVYATELSGQAILAGIRQRRVYVSVGPQLTFEAKANGTTYAIGADVGPVETPLELTATVTDAGPVTARLVKNGQILAEQTIVDGQGRLQLTDAPAPNQPVWYRLDLLGPDGQILAVTNPIFAGPQQSPARHHYGDFLSEAYRGLASD